ncbi:hypothetical protein K3N28_01105 [Glycomyces sp. TRM65418]|uniref:hypothetical protein n=1 Tax=Glycomyces sp. TRM65418 TaxID=2867006 RepID=UPI001CE5E416|nr:hypothetical protein [Glycomyces sp. TRM65418]MCC3761671.1 hypothetical protein [Glycomyces sp. TRM65418]QZD55765.1 hypothetical protein K3N28_01095 [Glycomyces sp. TRM65418]
MTDLSDFNEDERALIVTTPGVVLKGAIVSDGLRKPIAFLKEVTAGAKAFRQAQQHRNPLVKSVAISLRDSGSSIEEDRELPFTDEAMAKALHMARQAMVLLHERAAAEDAAAYGAWLISIATDVAKAASSKPAGFFSRKVAITPAEEAFIEELRQAVAG